MPAKRSTKSSGHGKARPPAQRVNRMTPMIAAAVGASVTGVTSEDVMNIAVGVVDAIEQLSERATHLRLTHGRRITEEDERFYQLMLHGSIIPDTQRLYRNYSAEVTEVTGGCTSAHFIQFLRLEYGKPLPPEGKKGSKEHGWRRVAVTMRGFKCACLHVCLLEQQPWTPDQSVCIDMPITAQRASLSGEQVRQLYNYCHAKI